MVDPELSLMSQRRRRQDPVGTVGEKSPRPPSSLLRTHRPQVQRIPLVAWERTLEPLSEFLRELHPFIIYPDAVLQESKSRICAELSAQ